MKMNASVDISMYPLQEDYETPILDFIHRLRQNKGVEVHTNALSTQISGDYDLIMALLSKEIKISFQQGFTQIMVLKILNIKIDLP